MGTRLGPYVLKDLLGQGGMGRVFLAGRSGPHEGKLGAELALKVLDPNLAKKQMIRDFFLQEGALGRDLRHPNLVAFADQGEVDGFLYLAFEYIQGVSLDKLIKKKGSFDTDLALSVLEDVTFGLAAAHVKGIIHRDLKPQNVMITPDNVIKVIDFGLAEADQGVGEGRTVGTPVYASPEQNLAKKTTPAADIYSLGLLTYEMFSGSRLLPGGGGPGKKGLQKVISQQVKLQKVLEKNIPLNAKIPPELTPILRRMLEFNPLQRYGNASKLAAVLEKTLPQSRIKRSEVLEQSKAKAIIEIADTHYQKALEYLRKGKYKKAATECRQLVSLRPPNLAKLKGLLRREIIAFTWSLELGGPVPEGTIPPMPDLPTLEGLAHMASVAELPQIKWILEERLVRLARHYDRDFWDDLVDRCWDSVPVMNALVSHPKATNVNTFTFTVPLTWLYLSVGCPNKAQETLQTGLLVDPENPALNAARLQVQSQIADWDAGREAIGALERILKIEERDRERLLKVVQFADNNPYLPEARELQIKEAIKVGDFEVAANAYIEIGIRDFLEGVPGLGLKHFVEAFRAQPSHPETAFFVVEALRTAGRVIHLPVDPEARTEHLFRLLGYLGPKRQELEASLTGGPEDREILAELAAVAADEPGGRSPESYLLKLARLEMEEGEGAEYCRALFDQVLGIAQDKPRMLQEIKAIPGIRRVFNRLDLARLASEF
jgi:serine/threonine protein kinase